MSGAQTKKLDISLQYQLETSLTSDRRKMVATFQLSADKVAFLVNLPKKKTRTSLFSKLTART